MTRAAPLPPAERREAILDAVLPLVLDQGRAISTREIAAASGIAEGTIFRVFDSKSDLIDQAIRRALAPGMVLAELGQLPPPADLGELVAAIVRTLQDHARTAHQLVTLLPPPGSTPPPHPMDVAARREITERTLAALVALLAPHADALTVKPRTAAGAILALSLGSSFSTLIDPTAVADILLHGISRTDHKA